MATPLLVSIALHYQGRPGDYGKGTGDFNFDAPAVQTAFNDLVRLGLLVRNDKNDPVSFRPTDGLYAWVNAICSVPLPVRQWVIPKEESGVSGSR